jgi:hypothetical protein
MTEESKNESISNLVFADRMVQKLSRLGLADDDQIFYLLDSRKSGCIADCDVEAFVSLQGYPKMAGIDDVNQAILSYLGVRDRSIPLNFNDFKIASEKRAKQYFWQEIIDMNSTLVRLFSDKLESLGTAIDIGHVTKREISNILSTGLDTMAERIMQNIEERSNQAKIPTAEEVNTKYSMAAGEDGMMSYGNLSDFEGGLDVYIGLPSLKIVWAIVQEHCNNPDSTVPFKKQNGKETTPKAEFEFVTCVEADLEFLKANFPLVSDELSVLWADERTAWPELQKPGQRRTRHSLSKLWLDNLEKVSEVNLHLIELISLILYTGPMYDKYNTSLRRFPKDKFEALQQNRYTSTIHTITSGLMKLSKAEKIPTNRIVYRGLGGKILPERFWKQDRRGCCGGVELGCMSTTCKVTVALQYSDKKVNQVCQGRPTICEIEIGQVDCGASLKWCSQFPDEDEILFGPLCNIERTGTARVEMIGGVLILVVPFRVNTNTKNLSLDQLEQRRKLLHLAAMDQLIWEADLELRHITHSNPSDLHKVADEARADFAAKRRQMALERSDWYNSDDNYVAALDDALKLKRSVVNQCVLHQKGAQLLAAFRTRARESDLALLIQSGAAPQPAAWLERQRVSSVLADSFDRGRLYLSDQHRFARAMGALHALGECLEDEDLAWHEADDCPGTRDAVNAFTLSHNSSIRQLGGSLARTIEYLDGKYGPLPQPRDPDRYFRDMLCCYKRALGQGVRRRSVFRCLELFAEGWAGEVPDFPAWDLWEAGLFARFCVGADSVQQFPLRRIETENRPLIELAAGFSDEEAAFLAAFLANRPPGKQVRVFIKGVSLQERPLLLLTGGGFDHVREGVADLQDMRIGADALRLLVHAAAHAPAGAGAVRELLLSRNHEIGEDGSGLAMGFVVDLARRLGCAKLLLASCRLQDSHLQTLTAAVRDGSRLGCLTALSLPFNNSIGAEALGRLAAVWAGSGRAPASLCATLY